MMNIIFISKKTTKLLDSLAKDLKIPKEQITDGIINASTNLGTLENRLNELREIFKTEIEKLKEENIKLQEDMKDIINYYAAYKDEEKNMTTTITKFFGSQEEINK